MKLLVLSAWPTVTVYVLHEQVGSNSTWFTPEEKIKVT